MSKEIEELIASFSTVKNDIKEIIKELPRESLNWEPLEDDSNSIYAIISHICGAEMEWIQGTIGGIKVERDRDKEFTATGENTPQLLELLDKTQQDTSDVLSKETLLSLARMVQRYPDRPETTALVCIINCLCHISEHVGQLQLTKQLLQMTK